MRKIVFIEPRAPNLHIFSQFVLPRLGIYILASLMRQRGWGVEIIFEEAEAIDFDSLKKADLVGISTITSTAPRAYLIADRLREMGIPVVLGGPHVTFMSDEALDHADFVIRGEGEHALMELVDAWEKQNSFSSVPNLSYWGQGKKIHNPAVGFIEDLDRIPFPDFLGHEKAEVRVGGHRLIPILTSRGCPFQCSFCSVTGMFGRKFRYRSPQNIIDELRQYDDKKNFVFFYDDNFTANRRNAQELLGAMIDEKFKFKWSAQVRVDIAKDEALLKLMKKAGCHTLHIGFESVNPKSLAEMRKSQTAAEIKQASTIIRRHGIHIHGMFVYGFDEDDWQTVRRTVEFAKRSKLTSSQFLILTPLPGSEIFGKLTSEKRILFKDWALYDGHHVVFKPARFSVFGLQRAQIFSHAKFYSLLGMVSKFLKGKWFDLGLAHYARGLNRLWQKKNRTFLKALDLLTPRKNEKIVIDYKQNITLDQER
jgi:radical SAM superfamily enzyme YgiQ (UPF0313 family)